MAIVSVSKASSLTVLYLSKQTTLPQSQIGANSIHSLAARLGLSASEDRHSDATQQAAPSPVVEIRMSRFCQPVGMGGLLCNRKVADRQDSSCCFISEHQMLKDVDVLPRTEPRRMLGSEMGEDFLAIIE